MKQAMSGAKKTASVAADALQFAQHGTVFAPCEAGDPLPTAADLAACPQQLRLGVRAVAGHSVPIAGGTVGFDAFCPGRAAKRVAYLHVPFYAARKGTYRLGIGADWWFEAWVDGKPLLSTLATGNNVHPPAREDWIAELALDAGEHLLVIRVLSGTAGMVVDFGTPRWSADEARLRRTGYRPTLVTEALTEREKAQFLESAYLASLWWANNQNTSEHPWGGIPGSADQGRFLYEYWPTTNQCRGAGVWSQALGICALFSMSKAPTPGGGPKLHAAARTGADYLCSLQFLDSRFPKNYGGFREGTPQFLWSYPRDAATGCFGLAQLYLETRKTEYLERANLFCEWYRRHGSDANAWPYNHFDFETGTGTMSVPGDWQAGGALAYYYTAKAAGDKHWMAEGFRPVMERLLEIGDPKGSTFDPHAFHGSSRITVGNDDFANIALVAAFREFQDERYLDLLRRRLDLALSLQDADGSFPNYAGTFVVGLELLEYIALTEELKLRDKTGRHQAALLRAARRGLAQQETTLRDVRAYGGLYGQSNYGVSRDRIHNRDCAYGLYLFLRLAGYTVPCASSFGW
jgi:hypothetical protein